MVSGCMRGGHSRTHSRDGLPPMVSQSGITEPWIVLHGGTYNLKEFSEIIDFADGRAFNFLTHLGARVVTAPNALRQLTELTHACEFRAREDVAVKKEQRAINRGAVPGTRPYASSNARPSRYDDRSRERRQWEWWRGAWYYRDSPYERWQRCGEHHDAMRSESQSLGSLVAFSEPSQGQHSQYRCTYRRDDGSVFGHQSCLRRASDRH